MKFFLNLLGYIIIFVISIFLLLNFTEVKNNSFLSNMKEILKSNISPKAFIFFQVIGDIERSSNKINNDYNTFFIPKTQLIEVEFKKINLMKNFKSKSDVGYAKHLKQTVGQKFFLEQYKNNILLLNSVGNLFYITYDKINDGKLQTIKTNLKFHHVFDLFIDNEIMFISGEQKKNGCSILHVVKSKISKLDEINFTTIFKSPKCIGSNHSGKIQKLYDSKKNSILLATAGDIIKDERDPKPQDDNSIYGKILEIDVVTKEFSNFSKGHRNILGFYTDENIMLATEMGPRGGDEINKIEFDKNYGWPISSYGTKYKYSLSNETLDYKSSHEDFGYEEPIFNFFASVGISEIIKIDDDFSNKWKDSFLVASLNGKHLYRLKFNKKFDKVIYIENIFINERIRDIIYFKDKNLILLALETSGSLGVIKSLN